PSRCWPVPLPATSPSWLPTNGIAKLNASNASFNRPRGQPRPGTAPHKLIRPLSAPGPPCELTLMQPPLVPSCGLASNGWKKANAARRTSSHVIATRVPPRACLRCATLTATNSRPRMLGPIISGHSTLVFTRPPHTTHRRATRFYLLWPFLNWGRRMFGLSRTPSRLRNSRWWCVSSPFVSLPDLMGSPTSGIAPICRFSLRLCWSCLTASFRGLPLRRVVVVVVVVVGVVVVVVVVVVV